MFQRQVKRSTAQLNFQVANNNSKQQNGKRKAETSPAKEMKRCALGDISNAKGNENVNPLGLAAPGKSNVNVNLKLTGAKELLKPVQSKLTTITNTKAAKDIPIKATKENKVLKPTAAPKPAPAKVAEVKPLGRVTRQSISIANVVKPPVLGRSASVHNVNAATVGLVPILKKPATRKSSGESGKAKSASPAAEETEEASLLYTTAIDASLLTATEKELNSKNSQLTKELKAALPDGVVDYDKEVGDDPFQVGLYAHDIFEYYKSRELKFPVTKYLVSQTELNKNMRSILVDWLVEVQESFELNHETLYLAVKLIDLFLGKVNIKRDKLQLVGTTAFWIASKFDERTSPSIDDFCYICDDAYSSQAILKMEVKMLKTLNYDIGAPLSYRFLRRYARCAKLDLEILTLARYILESSLMEYEFIEVRDSLMAGAALLLALSMHGISKPWTPTLEYYSGYKVTDLFDMSNRLLNMLRSPPAQVKTIKTKYSHRIFYEVAKLPLPDEIKID